jgi:hypothetical protein
MIEELLGGIPVVHYAPETPAVCPTDILGPTDSPAPPDADQVQAVDAVFSYDHEPTGVASLLGLWSSAMLLGDLAKDHLNPPDDECQTEEEKDEALPEEF